MAWVTALVLVAGIAVGSVVAWGRGSLNSIICGGECGPENVVAPEGLTIEGPAGESDVKAVASREVDAAAVRRAVAGPLRDGDLGSRVGFAAGPVGGGDVVTAGTSAAFTPASTTKVVTTFAALTHLDPEHRFATRTVLDGDRVVLVGGGDPYLVVRRSPGDPVVDRAQLTRLAAQTAKAVKEAGRTSVRLGYDTSLFSGPSASPDWEASYVRDKIVSPISALWVSRGSEGGVRVADPAASAASSFAGLLRDRGLQVQGEPASTKAPSDARRLGEVRSATVAQIGEHLVNVSDNETAEVMLRQAAIAAGRPGSFAGGVATVRSTLEAADVDTTGLELSDGSGLSRDNRISPRTLVDVLAAAGSRERTESLLADLPVGGFSGTLDDRFTEPAATRGAVRAKTGTLTGVHSVAGVATDKRGTPILFAVMTDRTRDINPFVTQAALDDVASAIAGCTCSR